jgi:hypothetical protein
VFVRRAAEVIHEARIHVDGLPGKGGVVLEHALRQPARGIQGEILHAIVVIQPSALPAD